METEQKNDNLEIIYKFYPHLRHLSPTEREEEIHTLAKIYKQLNLIPLVKTTSLQEQINKLPPK